MARVTGIGGLFFRSADPAATKQWYATHLGLPLDQPIWQQEAGPTVFAPFPDDADYFAPDRPWMLNLRVTGLVTLIANLRQAGIAVETRPEWDGDGRYGQFARLSDPDGLPIELWQPPAQP